MISLLDPILIFNNCNDYFSKVSTNTRSKILHSSKHFSDFLKNSNDKTIFLSPTDEKEVLICISHLNAWLLKHEPTRTEQEPTRTKQEPARTKQEPSRNRSGTFLV